MSATTNKPTHVTQSISDRKKSRELAEARQSGTMAPEIDIKTNAVINPHNPEFITKRPWYLGDGEEGPSLEHHNLEKEQTLTLSKAEALVKKKRLEEKQNLKKLNYKVGMWVEALKKNQKPFRICQILKMDKKKKKYQVQFEDGTVESNIKPKSMRMTKTGSRTGGGGGGTLKETYDSKRDAYHGYEITEGHTKRMQTKYAQRDELRREARSKEIKQQDDTTTTNNNKTNNSDSDSDYDDSDVGSDSDDEFVQRDDDMKLFTSRLARQGGVGGAQMKVTARNLRIREDTAKYLRNLDPNSAYYDPKSRSMRDNPNPNLPQEETQFAGDNFARISGDAVGLADTQLFAWDASKQHVDNVHPQANPSQAELLNKQFKTKSADLRLRKKQAVLDKYGGAEYMDGASSDEKKAAAERKARFGVSVTTEEYTRDGRLIKGGVAVKRVALQSKYEEDLYMNGHTTVWGSYFHRGAFRWGYADDHSLMKNSYGTGPNGRVANDEANEMRYGTGVAGSAALAQAREMLKAIPASERSGASSNSARPTSSKLYGEANQNANLDKNKVEEALKKVDASNREADKDRKRKYNSLNAQAGVTEEEMEAYRLRKERGDDPMAKLSDGGELLDYK